jgi:hypothetical protein
MEALEFNQFVGPPFHHQMGFAGSTLRRRLKDADLHCLLREAGSTQAWLQGLSSQFLTQRQISRNPVMPLKKHNLSS